MLAVTAGAWFVTLASSPGTTNASLAQIAGGLTVLSAFLLHEWGHWLGARWSGAQIYAPSFIASPFLYNFDAEQNTPRQFLLTSVFGFAATGLFLLLFFFALPAEHPATTIARYGGTALATLTLVFEVPIAIAVALGRPVPSLKLFPDRDARERARDTHHDAGKRPAGGR